MKLAAIEEKLVKRARAQMRSRDARRSQEMWAAGFLPDKFDMYRLDENDISLYLSDVQRDYTKYINTPHNALLDSKIVFDEIFRSHVPVAKVVGYAGELRFAMPGSSVGSFFAKPIGGGGGANISRCLWDGSRVTWKGLSLTPAQFRKELRKLGHRFFFSETVDQHAALKDLHPKTTNTLRLLVMKDRETSDRFIAAAVLRVGVSGSGEVDNFSQGGISVGVDPESGLTFGARDRSGRSLEQHPETGRALVGFQVPNWEKVLDLVSRASRVCPEIEYVGWDIIVTQDGAVLLEGNNCSDVNLLQVHKPLLENPRVRAFYDRFGILGIRPTMALQQELTEHMAG